MTDVPDAPAAPTVKEIFKDNALVTWQLPAKDNGSPVTGYTLERMSSFSPRWVVVNKEPVPVTELRVTDLVEDNSYQFRVTAINAAGPSKPSEPSPSVKAKDPWSKCSQQHLLSIVLLCTWMTMLVLSSLEMSFKN